MWTETAAISSYLDDSITSLNDKGKTWLDIAEDAGVILPTTIYFKPAGSRTITARTV
jgi:hypothetical protein